ncbi:MAG: response regulator transcription factor [Elusimicrobiota bacterium]|nr:response regulator transcription factor [Elusimicrobiota bacterium]
MIEGRILLLGDDPKTAPGLKKTLEKEAFALYQVKGKSSVKEKITRVEPELIILDYGSSSEDNFIICEQIKQDKSLRNIPVVIISNISQKKELIRALEIGADDCLSKPIDFDIFLARLRAILRRISYREEPEEILKCKDIVINLTTRTLMVKNKPVKLTPKEFALLYVLMKKKGRALDRSYLMKSVWDEKYMGDPRTINKHIETLRKKLGPEAKRQIETVAGIGYMLRA